jgi:LEA14-like dessication related protein
VVFVQVTNPASAPMRLTKLEYVFAAQGTTVSTGELALARDVPGNSTVVVEVPLSVERDGALTLKGRLTAVVDEIVHNFSVSAKVGS